MKLILLSGGSGKRLWPLSNDTRSKQFLKMLETSDGRKESMVQRVWRQIESEGLASSSVIATSKLQKEMIYNQLGLNVPIVTEPERRDTFPAIALAASYLYSVEETDINEVIVVLPVDPYVDDGFFRKIKELEVLINESKSDLALIGVKPTYPSSKYGYIVPKNQKANFLEVDRFTEKPNEEKAASLIQENALWNCGVFAFSLKYILNMLEDRNLPLDYESLKAQYHKLPKISFDYEVVEKTDKIVALPYDGYWKDLGTWNTLSEEMATTLLGKGVISSDSSNTHLINELDIPVTVIGGKDLIVAVSSDGILVSDKASSPKIKDFIKDFTNPPMYEERLWGWSRTLDYSKYDDDQEMVTKRICIYKGKNSTYHYHNLRNEVWTIIKGEGELALDDKITRIKAGDVIHLPAGKKHAILAMSELEFIEVQTGLGIVPEDIHRLAYSWIDVLSYFKKSKATIIS